jgi:hypothetical protein
MHEDTHAEDHSHDHGHDHMHPHGMTRAEAKAVVMEHDREMLMSSMSQAISTIDANEEITADLRDSEIRASMYKRIRAQYAHQYEHHEITSSAASTLELAATKGIFEPPTSPVEVAWEKEFDDLTKFTVKIPEIALTLTRIPLLSYFAYPYAFSRILSSLEAILGYYRSHEETLHHFKIAFPDDDLHVLNPFLVSSLKIMNTIRLRFPEVYTVGQTLFTARYIVRIKRDEVASRASEGFLSRQDLEGVVGMLNDALNDIEQVRRDWRLARICLQRARFFAKPTKI